MLSIGTSINKNIEFSHSNNVKHHLRSRNLISRSTIATMMMMKLIKMMKLRSFYVPIPPQTKFNSAATRIIFQTMQSSLLISIIKIKTHFAIKTWKGSKIKLWSICQPNMKSIKRITKFKVYWLVKTFKILIRNNQDF